MNSRRSYSLSLERDLEDYLSRNLDVVDKRFMLVRNGRNYPVLVD